MTAGSSAAKWLNRNSPWCEVSTSPMRFTLRAAMTLTVRAHSRSESTSAWYAGVGWRARLDQHQDIEVSDMDRACTRLQIAAEPAGRRQRNGAEDGRIHDGVDASQPLRVAFESLK